MLWDFRYRSPRAVITKQIETVTENEAEARELAEAALQQMATPSVKFVYLQPSILARTVDHPELLAKWSATPAVPAAAPAIAPDRFPGMSGVLHGTAPAPEVGKDEFDDEMSGPRVANPKGGRSARVGV